MAPSANPPRSPEGDLILPPPPAPAGLYEPFRIAGGLLFLSGQFPLVEGVPACAGRVGEGVTEDEAREAARIAAMNALSQIHAACGHFDRLTGLVRVEGHVASAPGWNRAPYVLDGASDLFLRALGERGRHARTAFTPRQLPWDLTIELVVTAAVNDAG